MKGTLRKGETYTIYDDDNDMDHWQVLHSSEVYTDDCDAGDDIGRWFAAVNDNHWSGRWFARNEREKAEAWAVSELDKLKKTRCPRCEQDTMRPEQVMNALSRRDNETYICSSCGVAEAMEDFFTSRTNNA